MDEIDQIVADGVRRNLENRKKFCYECKEEKALIHFVTSRICSHGKRNICKSCYNKKNRKSN